MQDVGSNHFYLWRSGALLREVTGVSGSYLGVYQVDACERGTFQAENITSNDTEMRTLVHRRSPGPANTAAQQEHHKAGRALCGLAEEVSRRGQQGPACLLKQ